MPKLKLKPICQQARHFVQVRLGKDCFAPFTGQDSRAFSAFVHLLELYAAADDRGRAIALDAMMETVSAAQQSVRLVFKAAIPCVLDWSDEAPIWKKVACRCGCGGMFVEHSP